MQCTEVKESTLEICNYLKGNHREEMARDVREGMRQPQKRIPSKYFYDAVGSQLFEHICCTPEYYPTRTELSILDQNAADIMAPFAEKGGDLVELGSGANIKIRKLLDAVAPSDLPGIRYVPVEISRSCLAAASEELLTLYDGLTVFGVAADFTRHLDMLPDGRKLIIFFGSTIGNFSPADRHAFLTRIARIMDADDRFLIGLDMVKPVEVLEAAYNDQQGVTADFNRNILNNVNRELNADFNPDDFEHWAFFNAAEERMEMHLRARRDVVVNITDLSLCVGIRRGETIHTEVCQKFTRESAGNTFNKAGLSVNRWFTDPEDWFSLVELKTA